jgi:mRNA-degrading endonuclease RelE of RelBE toxin-antitoxin system
LEPVRELRIGDWRVFYDVDEQDSLVVVRAIRRKSPGKTTEDIL